jgi:hypothetical protein
MAIRVIMEKIGGNRGKQGGKEFLADPWQVILCKSASLILLHWKPQPTSFLREPTWSGGFHKPSKYRCYSRKIEKKRRKIDLVPESRF